MGKVQEILNFLTFCLWTYIWISCMLSFPLVFEDILKKHMFKVKGLIQNANIIFPFVLRDFTHLLKQAKARLWAVH